MRAHTLPKRGKKRNAPPPPRSPRTSPCILAHSSCVSGPVAGPWEREGRWKAASTITLMGTAKKANRASGGRKKDTVVDSDDAEGAQAKPKADAKPRGKPAKAAKSSRSTSSQRKNFRKGDSDSDNDSESDNDGDEDGDDDEGANDAKVHARGAIADFKAPAKKASEKSGAKLGDDEREGTY